MRRIVSLVLAGGCCAALAAEPPDPGKTWNRDWNNDGRWNESEVGPFLASTLRTPGGVVAKGLTVRLGDPGSACAVYDTASCSLRAAWTGGFLQFHPRKFGVVQSPSIVGEVEVVCSQAAWGGEPVQFRGHHQHGERLTLEYEVGGTRVLESPGIDATGADVLLTRAFEIAPCESPLRLLLSDQVRIAEETMRPRVVIDGDPDLVLHQTSDVVALEIPAGDKPRNFRVAYLRGEGVPKWSAAADFARWCAPGAPLWDQWLPVESALGAGDRPYTIDTVGVPFDNPYKALMFLSGHDFLPDGMLAACTLHGDVWLVRGIDDKLGKVEWRRFATGLYQPLGLKVIGSEIYVLGRDQITRLHDRDGDGSADFYECFNNAGATSTSGHDYASSLQTDSEGNFYYIRAHEGVVRVSADGATSTPIATGFRNPIGLGVGPAGQITAAPQEGEWTPASAIFAVREGGYYGFGGPRVSPERPLGYDPPLCWLPRVQDTSSGDQVWVEGGRWGLPVGTMLHLSYGQCTLMIVMQERVGGVAQGGTFRFPLRFQSGSMRGRFNPRDGQLYVSGLRGWQTAGVKDGCLQRVRYTGKPIRMPTGLRVTRDGFALSFSCELDPELAGDPESFAVSVWNYRYSAEYGSKQYRSSEPETEGVDRINVTAARLAEDRKTVLVTLEKMEPVMQMEIDFDLETPAGEVLAGKVYNTVHVVPGGG